MFICLAGRRENFPRRLELRLCRVEVLGRAHREAAAQVDGDVPQPDPRLALKDEADPADALPAFEYRIVIDADYAASAYSCGLRMSS